MYPTPSGIRKKAAPQHRIAASFIPAFILALALRAFGIDFLLATSFDQALPDKWLHAQDGAASWLAHRDTVYAELPWRINVLFNDYNRDYIGNVALYLSYKIIKPDGTLYYDTSGIAAITRIMPRGIPLLLSHRIPVVSFTRNEAPGNYKLMLTAEDAQTGAKKMVEKTITLAEYPKTSSNDFTDISFNVWVHSYCLNPDPGRAISAFSYFIGRPMSDKDEIFWPVFYFFECLFYDNPMLTQKLARTIPKSPARLKEYTVFLLRALRINKSDVAGPIPDSLWSKFDRVSENGFDGPFTDAFTAGSAGLIESGFYYYGSYAMVRFLINCLGITTPTGYEAFIADCKEYAADVPRNFDKETTLRFYTEAQAILKKTYRKNPLITTYCDYALAHDHLDPVARRILVQLIASSTAP